jgi:hypothetical protein
MNKFTRILTVGGFPVLFAGCMHTVVGNGLGVPSPDGRFRLAVEVHGASAKSYVAETKKRVYIWVMPSGTNNPPPVFSGKYDFVAAGLNWHMTWLSTNRVSVEFVDYGPGVSNYDRQRNVTNHIAQLTFAEHDRVFVEEKK